jgi:hypothetical protein
MSHKPYLFIGSSSEGLPVAKEIKEQLCKVADVTIWNEGIFEINKSYLDSLLDANFLFDFAILVFTPDDLLKTRGKKVSAARDNVIFEMGLSLGRLGPRRSYIVCDDSVNVLSDFTGISLLKFTRPKRGPLKEPLGKVCEQLKLLIKKGSQQAELGFLPSTTLAIGYFFNFLKKVCDKLLNDIQQMEINGIIWVNKRNFKITVIIPEKLAFTNPAGRDERLKEINLTSIAVLDVKEKANPKPGSSERPYPLYIRADIKENEFLDLYDLPTTLYSSVKAIDLIVPDKYIGLNEFADKLQLKEINNFKLTLEKLLDDPDNDIYKKYIELKYQEYLQKSNNKNC